MLRIPTRFPFFDGLAHTRGVEAAVDKLTQEKLITERVAARHIQKASVVDLPGE